MPDDAVQEEPKGAPAVPPAKSEDHCTPDEVLEPVYRILGPEVGIDPAWNPKALIRARHTVSKPPGARSTDVCGGLVEPWHEHGTFFNNPPFGKDVVDKWVAKAAKERRLGAEGIQLLPSYTSAYFFDDLWRNASAICFWGRPGRTNSRVQFVGAKDPATFAIILAYYGDNVEYATQVLDEYGHVLPPQVVRSWMRLVGGHVIPGAGAEIDEEAMGDPLYQANRRLQRKRYDDLIYAAHPVQELSIGELVDAESPLIERILDLTIGEVVGGLSALASGLGDSVQERQVPTRRRIRSSAPKKIDDEPDDTLQAGLFPEPSHAERERLELDREILEIVRRHNSEGVTGGDLKRALEGVSAGRFRGSLKRLHKAALITSSGGRASMRYYPTRKV